MEEVFPYTAKIWAVKEKVGRCFNIMTTSMHRAYTVSKAMTEFAIT